MTRSYGLIPSGDNDDDQSAHLLLGSPSSATVLDSVVDLVPLAWIHNQLSTSSCVWEAISQALRVWLLARGLVPPDFWPSVLFGYWNTLKRQGAIVDAGCQPRTALQVLTDSGFCRDSDWAFDPGAVLNQPLPDAYTAANDQKIVPSYYRLTATGDDLILQIKTALSKKYPVIYGSPVDADYESYTGGRILGPRTGQILGNHMRCLIGYTPDYAIEANSWGSWGIGGTAHIGWDWLTSSQVFERWAFEVVPKPTGGV